ncbi:hypothetical protein PFICI_10119 [Pestalotiopsis fici W106-1]|uniref:Amidase domain-containing protein n=1 Tax=Pestalotiopsis fici (strain W106-1 / CGMCC3.15140) TaxID=1229662 RepID=W3WY29_PESFW|nr:uncharacterized protein PFICI_10119 [Pestalotiopsis fici W106-1]ETS78057.1 hypothetical protein PFICI_10119 [Pestalotiopsis fici W106-1]
MTLSCFDPLTTDAVDLQLMLESNKITSVQIIEQCLQQIERHEAVLNALISVAPRETLLHIAAALDDERRAGHIRSPLHGIPIVLKDCFITASELGMTTTAGSVVFAGATASKNGVIVQKLIDAGLIIIAKGNMTEFAGMKTIKMMPGWSSYGGQTISPYTGAIKPNERLLGHSAPGGSSTGSAVAVAAGYSPLAMAGETIGSIVTPTVRTALFALKPTHGVQDAAGMYRMAEFFDTPGPMGKCAADVISLSEILLGRSLQSARDRNLKDLSIGFVDPNKWKMAEAMCEQFEGTEAQMIRVYEAAVARIEQNGGAVKYPIEIAELSALEVDGKDAIMPIAYSDFKNLGIPAFIEGFDDCPVSSLQDIVDFNLRNKSTAMPEPYPEQDQLIQALNTTEGGEDLARLKKKFRELGKSIINEVLDREKVHVIVTPGDSPLCIHAAVAGYPHVTVPLGVLDYNGRPFGLCVIGKEHEEELLLHFMAAYESISPPRAVPLRIETSRAI